MSNVQIQSEQINELATALAKAQGQIRNAAMDRKNPHYKSKYADLASVWDACRGPLSANNLSVVQTMIRAESGQTELVTTLFHASGQWIRGYLPLTPSKNDAQAIGSAITYARRQSLAAIAGVAPDDDDDDGETAVDRPQNGNGRKPPSSRTEDVKEHLKSRVVSESLSEQAEIMLQRIAQSHTNEALSAVTADIQATNLSETDRGLLKEAWKRRSNDLAQKAWKANQQAASAA